MSKILILGCNGMLGSDLASSFHESHEVVLWDKEELDITNRNDVANKISLLKPGLIVNATGYTNVDGAEDDQAAAFKLNDEAVSYLVAAANDCGAKFVHFSTEYVFDGKSESGYNELVVPRPLNIYGESKAAGELHVINYERGYLVRTSWLYGRAPQKGKPRGMNFIDTILKFAAEQPEVRVVNDQFGKLTATRDLANAVVQLTSSDLSPGIYHLVNEGEVSWYEVAREVFRLKGITVPLLPVSSDEFPTKARRPQRAVLLNTKSPKLRPWQQALRDYLNVSQTNER